MLASRPAHLACPALWPPIPGDACDRLCCWARSKWTAGRRPESTDVLACRAIPSTDARAAPWRRGPTCALARTCAPCVFCAGSALPGLSSGGSKGLVQFGSPPSGGRILQLPPGRPTTCPEPPTGTRANLLQEGGELHASPARPSARCCWPESATVPRRVGGGGLQHWKYAKRLDGQGAAGSCGAKRRAVGKRQLAAGGAAAIACPTRRRSTRSARARQFEHA